MQTLVSRMHGSLRISICTTQLPRAKDGREKRKRTRNEFCCRNVFTAMQPRVRKGEGTYIGYHWNVATLRDYSFHIAGSFGPEYGCNAIAYHLSDGLGGQHRITLGVIPAQL